MKKLAIAAVATTALIFTSCNKSGVKATLNDEVDTIAYEYGIAQGSGLKDYAKTNLQIDSAYFNDFIRGVKDGANKTASKSEDAYRKGCEIGAQVKQMAEGLTQEIYRDDSTKSVNVQNILAGIIEGFTGYATMSADSAFTDFQKKIQAIIDANLKKQYATEIENNQKFLSENKKKEGVVTLPSGLQYKVLIPGTDERPADSVSVKCHYEGKLIDGSKFDSSYDNGEPMVLNNLKENSAIPGFMEAIRLMTYGSKWEVYIPENLAYGSRDMGKIKPFSTLIFTIELLKK